MVDRFKETILDKGFVILNSGPTRTKDTIDSKPACLDFIMTNKPDKVANFQSGIPNFSDHSLQIMNRSTKGFKNKQRVL